MPTVKKQSPTKKTALKPKKTGIAAKIKPLGFDDTEGLAINLYGRSGTGKTTLACTFPGKILSLICSGNKRPGELRSVDTIENRRKIDTIVVDSTDEIAQIIEHVENTTEYETIILDHATGLQDLVLKEILGIDSIPEQKSWGLATQQQYGQCTQQSKEFLRAILGLRQNRIIVAHEREFNTGDSEATELIKPFVASALTPSLTGWLNGTCDYLCNTFIRQKTAKVKTKLGGKTVETEKIVPGEVEYCLRVKPDSVHAIKFRVPRGYEMPDVIVDPTYEKIKELIEHARAIKKGK